MHPCGRLLAPRRWPARWADLPPPAAAAHPRPRLPLPSPPARCGLLRRSGATGAACCPATRSWPTLSARACCRWCRPRSSSCTACWSLTSTRCSCARWWRRCWTRCTPSTSRWRVRRVRGVKGGPRLAWELVCVLCVCWGERGGELKPPCRQVAAAAPVCALPSRTGAFLYSRTDAPLASLPHPPRPHPPQRPAPCRRCRWRRFLGRCSAWRWPRWCASSARSTRWCACQP